MLRKHLQPKLSLLNKFPISMAFPNQVEVIIFSISANGLNYLPGRGRSSGSYIPNMPYAVFWVDHPNNKRVTNVSKGSTTNPYWNEQHVIRFPGPVDGNTTLFIHIVHATDEEETATKLIGSAQLKLLEVGIGHRVKCKLILQQRPSSGHHHEGEVYVEVAVLAASYSHGGYPPLPPPVYQHPPQPPSEPSLLTWIATRLGVDVAVNFISGLFRGCLGGGENEDHLSLLNHQF